MAAFSASATSIAARETVTFTDESTGNPTSWSWTFEGGDPETSTDRNPTVRYSASFPVGELKWADLEKLSEHEANRFVFNDLSSNGNYTEARMFIVGKGHEVVIGIFTTNQGSFQRWTRE